MPNVATHPLVSTSGREPDNLPPIVLDDSSRLALLLVAPDAATISADALVLTNSNYCVSSAFSDGEIFAMRHNKAVALAILSASLGYRGLHASAEAVRRQWPLARILILGRSAFGLEDYLYDEQIGQAPEPTQLLEALERLSKEPRNQSTNTVDLDAWRFGASLFRSSIQESDPTKAAPFAPTDTGNLRGQQSGARPRQL